jgi:hypothetical protein
MIERARVYMIESGVPVVSDGAAEKTHSKRLRRGSGLAVVAVVVVLAVSACGTSHLDSKKLEQKISSTITTQVGVKPDQVSCPKHVKARKGDTFQCVARVEGQDTAIQVTQKDNKGNADVSNVDALIYTQKLVAQIAQQTTSQTGERITVDCGSTKIVVRKVDSTFTCRLRTADGITRSITVHVRDKTGTVDWKVE